MDKIKEPPAVTIRQPATANLMVDSADRSQGTWGNFQITRNQSILNGFFNRIGTTEIVLEWAEPNVSNSSRVGDTVTVTVGGTDYTVTLFTGFYTVSQLFAQLCDELDAQSIPGATWTFTENAGIYFFGAGVNFDVADTPLARAAGIYDPGQDNIPARAIGNPDLRPYRYIDFVSQQLTYNQDLKDAATTEIVRDILARWYFAWDSPAPLDADGFPIQMGYQPFIIRRTFSPPKQIRWDNIQPVGNLTFQVYDDLQQAILSNDENNFLMTLQISEN